MKIISLIKLCDFLGPELKFRINNQENFKTVFGGLLSLIYLILLSIFFFIFGKDFFLRKNPKVITQYITPVSKYSSKAFSSKNFSMAFKLVKGRSETVPIFLNKTENFYLNHELFGKNFSQPNITKLNLKKCKESDFIFKINSNATDYICPDFGDGTLQLGGGYETINEFFGNLAFSLKISQSLFENYNVDNENNKTIANQKTEEFLKIIQEAIYLEMILPQAVFDPSDFEDPLKIEAKYHYAMLSFGSGVYDLFFFSDYLVETDAGILTETPNTQIETGYDRKLNHNFIFNETNNISWYYAEFNFDKAYNYSTRQYMKFQDLLGNVSGFMDLVTFVFSVFISLNADYKLTKYIANKLIYVLEEDTIRSKTGLDIKKESFTKINGENANDNNKFFNRLKIDANKPSRKYEKSENLQMEDLRSKINSFNHVKVDNEGSKSGKELNNKNDLSSNTFVSNHSSRKLNDNYCGNKNFKNIALETNNSLSLNEEVKTRIKFCLEIPKAKSRRFLEYGFLDQLFQGKFCKFKSQIDNDKSKSYQSIAERIYNQALEKFDILFYLKFINNFKLTEKLILDSNVRFLIQSLSEKEFFYKCLSSERELKLVMADQKEPDVNNVIDHFLKSVKRNSVSKLEEKRFLEILKDFN